MKKILSILLLALVVFSCEENQETEGYQIAGTVENVTDGTEVYITELDENQQPVHVDTTVIKEGKFELNLPETEAPTVSFLSVEGVPGNVVYLSENEKIKFNIYKDSIRSSLVTGGVENKLFQEYINHLQESGKNRMEARMALQQAFQAQDTLKMTEISETQQARDEEELAFKRKMFEENKDRLVSAVILTDMINMKLYPTREIKEMYSSLSEKVKNSTLGQYIENTLEKQGAVEVGSKAPNFEAPTPTGEMLSLKDAMGKVTVVDFWASWCKPCRIENPNVVRIYNKYHDKGLNIVGVSLDKASQKDKWLEAIEKDNLTWQHVSNLEYWNEPIAQTYGVRSIPATFVLDENGVIVAKDLRGDDLEKKIAELLESQQG